MRSKAEIRKKYMALRAQHSLEEIQTDSLRIANHTLNLPIWENTYFHLFLSIVAKHEVDTEFLLHILQGREKSIVVSRSDFDTNTLLHFLLQENTPLRISKYGIPEPVSGIAIDPKTLDVVFVPLLAFDHTGNRIGYGKGFYDRFLAECRPDCVFVGLSLFGPEAQIPASENDVPLDYCVTPDKVYDF